MRFVIRLSLCGGPAVRRFRRYMSGNYRGFSLIELLIVIALMALLVSLVSPRAMGFLTRFSSRLAIQQIDNAVKKMSYTAFIRQQPCELSIIDSVAKNDQDAGPDTAGDTASTDPGRTLLVGTCQDEEIVSVVLDSSKRALPLSVKRRFPMLINSRGIEIVDVEEL